jgi:digalactosyldiacylglycerol synthase
MGVLDALFRVRAKHDEKKDKKKHGTSAMGRHRLTGRKKKADGGAPPPPPAGDRQPSPGPRPAAPDSPTAGLVSSAATATTTQIAPPLAVNGTGAAHTPARHLSPEPVMLSEPSFSVHGGGDGSAVASPARGPGGEAVGPPHSAPRPPPPPSPPPPSADFLYAAASLHTTPDDLADSAALTAPGRSFTIVTTAALPWLTGTAVNPALRAAYLARALPRSKVRLLLPWLAPADQAKVFAPSLRFASPAAQQEWVRAWLADRMGGGDGCSAGGSPAPVASPPSSSSTPPPSSTPSSSSIVPAFEFVWYQGRYDPALCSIFPYGNLIDLIPLPERDVAILEEPEHLTWYHHGPRWSESFAVAIGVAHTNYCDYVKAAKGAAAARVLRAANAALVGAHCHRVVKLSGAVQRLPRQVTCFVHGVAPAFLQVGIGKTKSGGGDSAGAAADGEDGKNAPTAGAYFLGKALMAKGWANALALLDPAHPDLPPGTSPPAVEGFGSGEDAAAIAEAARSTGAPLAMHPGIDHLSPTLRRFRVFWNPSTSDVVATTSAEALAMGRWLVVPRHPCNAFFAGFAGCLVYDTPAEFFSLMATALSTPPPPLTGEEARALTWQAATERFLAVAAGCGAGGGGEEGSSAAVRGVRRSPSEDAGFLSDGAGGPLPAHLPRGGSGAASTAALSALMGDGGLGDDASSSASAAVAALAQPPPSALGSADSLLLATPPRPAVPRSGSTLAFAPTPSPVKGPPRNPASRLAARAKAALGAFAYRAFDAAAGVEAVRRVMGAGAFTRDAPPAPPGHFDPTDRAALAAAAAGREAAADAHARLGYPRPRYVG